MQTVTKKLIVESPPSKPATGKAPEIASASVPDTLAALHVKPEMQSLSSFSALGDESALGEASRTASPL